MLNNSTVIHPRQIEAVNLAFSPTVEDVSESTAILKTFLAYRDEERAVFQVDGNLLCVFLTCRTISGKASRSVSAENTSESLHD